MARINENILWGIRNGPGLTTDSPEYLREQADKARKRERKRQQDYYWKLFKARERERIRGAQARNSARLSELKARAAARRDQYTRDYNALGLNPSQEDIDALTQKYESDMAAITEEAMQYVNANNGFDKELLRLRDSKFKARVMADFDEETDYASLYNAYKEERRRSDPQGEDAQWREDASRAMEGIINFTNGFTNAALGTFGLDRMFGGSSGKQGSKQGGAKPSAGSAASANKAAGARAGAAGASGAAAGNAGAKPAANANANTGGTAATGSAGTQPANANAGAQPANANAGTQPANANAGAQPASANAGGTAATGNAGTQPASANAGGTAATGNAGTQPANANANANAGAKYTKETADMAAKLIRNAIETKQYGPNETEERLGLALEFIAGKFGNGETRMTSAGPETYDSIQPIVNRYYQLAAQQMGASSSGTEASRPQETPQEPAPAQETGGASGGDARLQNMLIALEVLDGKWGNDPEREQRLREAGHDRDAIQGIVDEYMAKYGSLEAARAALEQDIAKMREGAGQQEESLEEPQEEEQEQEEETAGQKSPSSGWVLINGKYVYLEGEAYQAWLRDHARKEPSFAQSLGNAFGGYFSNYMGGIDPSGVSTSNRAMAEISERAAADYQKAAQRNMQIANQNYRDEAEKNAAAQGAQENAQKVTNLGNASAGAAALARGTQTADYDAMMARSDEQFAQAGQNQAAMHEARGTAEQARVEAKKRDWQSKDWSRDNAMREWLSRGGLDEKDKKKKDDEDTPPPPVTEEEEEDTPPPPVTEEEEEDTPPPPVTEEEEPVEEQAEEKNDDGWVTVNVSDLEFYPERNGGWFALDKGATPQKAEYTYDVRGMDGKPIKRGLTDFKPKGQQVQVRKTSRRVDMEATTDAVHASLVGGISDYVRETEPKVDAVSEGQRANPNKSGRASEDSVDVGDMATALSQADGPRSFDVPRKTGGSASLIPASLKPGYVINNVSYRCTPDDMKKPAEERTWYVQRPNQKRNNDPKQRLVFDIVELPQDYLDYVNKTDEAYKKRSNKKR